MTNVQQHRELKVFCETCNAEQQFEYVSRPGVHDTEWRCSCCKTYYDRKPPPLFELGNDGIDTWWCGVEATGPGSYVRVIDKAWKAWLLYYAGFDRVVVEKSMFQRERGAMLSYPHGTHSDWCHLCGYRERDTADVWYPDNAEHGDKRTRHVRICMECADLIAVVADRSHRPRTLEEKS